MNQSKNQTAKREAKQLAQYERNVVLHRLLNEPIEPFRYRAAKAKKPAPPVRSIPKQANRRPGNLGPFSSLGVPRDSFSKSDSVSSAASAYSRGFSANRASITQTSDGVIIRKRELLSSITGSVNFTVAQTYALNPGLASSFPWLSTQAMGWEQYRFRKLRYIFYTRTGTSTPGSVMLVPDYDAADAVPINEQQAMDYKDAKEEAPWVVEFCCDLTPSALHPGGRKFIRQGVVVGTDIKTYDAGNMFVITTDGTAVNWGKVFVEYEVELAVSQLPQGVLNVASGIATATTTTNSLAGMVYSPGANGAIILAGTANSLSWTGLGVGLEYSLTYTAPVNTFTLNYSSLVGGTVISTNSAVAAVNAFFVNFKATASSGSITLTVSVSNPGATLVLLSPIGTPVAV
jgi:hypothetical protein